LRAFEATSSLIGYCSRDLRGIADRLEADLIVAGDHTQKFSIVMFRIRGAE
jgi:hypothetical protein